MSGTHRWCTTRPLLVRVNESLTVAARSSVSVNVVPIGGRLAPALRRASLLPRRQVRCDCETFVIVGVQLQLAGIVSNVLAVPVP